VGWGRVQEEHDMGPWGGRYSCCKRGAARRGVCDGLIGAFHGSGGGYAKVHFCCTFCICAYLSALLSLGFSFLIFLRKFLGCQGWLVGGCGVTILWLVSTVLLILIRLICWVVGESCLVSLQRKLFSVSVFSLIFMASLAIFS